MDLHPQGRNTLLMLLALHRMVPGTARTFHHTEGSSNDALCTSLGSGSDTTRHSIRLFLHYNPVPRAALRVGSAWPCELPSCGAGSRSRDFHRKVEVSLLGKRCASGTSRASCQPADPA